MDTHHVTQPRPLTRQRLYGVAAAFAAIVLIVVVLALHAAGVTWANARTAMRAGLVVWLLGCAVIAILLAGRSGT